MQEQEQPFAPFDYDSSADRSLVGASGVQVEVGVEEDKLGSSVWVQSSAAFKANDSQRERVRRFIYP